MASPKTIRTQEIQIYDQNVLGLQGCLWTPLFSNETALQFMTFPRLAALSEAAWTESEKKNLENFKERLPALLQRHDVLGDYYFNCFDQSKTPEPKGSKLAYDQQFTND